MVGHDMKNRLRRLHALAARHLAGVIGAGRMTRCHGDMVRALRLVRRLPLLLAPMAVLGSAPAAAINYDFTYTVTPDALIWSVGSTHIVGVTITNTGSTPIPTPEIFKMGGSVQIVSGNAALSGGAAAFYSGPVSGPCTATSASLDCTGTISNASFSGTPYTLPFTTGQTIVATFAFALDNGTPGDRIKICVNGRIVSGSYVDTNDVPGCAEVQVGKPPTFDLTISKAAVFQDPNDPMWNIGSAQKFRIEVRTNPWVSPVSPFAKIPPGSVITVIDTLPPQFQPGFAGPSPWSCQWSSSNLGTTVTCTYVIPCCIPFVTSPPLDIPVIPRLANWIPVPGSYGNWEEYSNTATVQLSGPAFNPKAVAELFPQSNNTATAKVRVRGYDLTIRKTPVLDPAGGYWPGTDTRVWPLNSQQTYEIKLYNNGAPIGPGGLQLPVGSKIQITESMPPGIKYTGFVPNQFWMCSPASNAYIPSFTCEYTYTATLIPTGVYAGVFPGVLTINVEVTDAIPNHPSGVKYNTVRITKYPKATAPNIPAPSNVLSDDNPDNDFDSRPVIVRSPYDVAVTKTYPGYQNTQNWPANLFWTPGSNQSYYITVSNLGIEIPKVPPEGPIAVHVTDRIPDGVTLIGAYPSDMGWTCSSNVPLPATSSSSAPVIVDCWRDGMAAGESVSFQLKVKAAENVQSQNQIPGIFIMKNCAKVAFLPAVVDSAPGNNESCVVSYLECPGCRLPACNPPMIPTAAGACACPDGMRQRGRQCSKPVECRAPMVANAAGTACACPSGMRQRAGECLKGPECRAPMAVNAAGVCACPQGTQQRGRECVKGPECRAPMVANRAGVCACPEGTRQQGRECVRAPACRPPMIANPAGPGCICPPGLTQRGEECVRAAPDRPARPATPATPEQRGR